MKGTVAETRSHEVLWATAFTSIQISHNTISAPHVDNNLAGFPSFAAGLGDYEGGRLRVDGVRSPIYIRNHAVISDGLKTLSSGKLNGDRWSLVPCVHASWQKAPTTLASDLRQLGFPCPLTTSNALPATVDDTTSLAGAGSFTDIPASDIVGKE